MISGMSAPKILRVVLGVGMPALVINLLRLDRVIFKVLRRNTILASGNRSDSAVSFYLLDVADIVGAFYSGVKEVGVVR